MRRFVFVPAFTIFSILWSILSMAHAAACPEAAPIPLRGLYLQSAMVVVGTIGKAEKWKAIPQRENANENHQQFSRGVALKVEEVIKGIEVKNLSVVENDYVWLGEPTYAGIEDGPPTKVEKKVPEPEFESDLTENKERRLFFLSKDEETGGYSETYANRVFSPTGKELDIYISRLRELNNIYSVAKPSKELVVEWLVSMAENPVTRYEGAFELRQILANSENEDEEELDEDKDADAGETKSDDAESVLAPSDENTGETDIDRPEYDPYVADVELAKLITGGQKERLVNAFLNIRFNYEPFKNSEGEYEYPRLINDADTQLLDAITSLRDRRVIDRLLAELPTAAQHQPSDTSDLLRIISRFFDDDKLNTLAEKYSDVSWRDENDEIENTSEAYDLPAVTDELPAADSAKENKAPEVVSIDDLVPADQLPPKTYGQRRAELFEKIQIRCNELAVERSGRK